MIQNGFILHVGDYCIIFPGRQGGPEEGAVYSEVKTGAAGKAS